MDEQEVSVKVWDLPVRAAHWALVLLFAFQLLTASLGDAFIDWHMRSGYAILAVVLFRVLWGFAGSTTARFASFLARPADAWRFGRRLWARRAEAMAGHNPLGGWMVVALLAALLVQVGTGLFSNDGIATEGPLARLLPPGLSDRVTTLHHWNFRILLMLAGVHVAAVLYHWLALKE
ncbi:MAG TPA: cytochrome b/b6 domain-containing protein, partial [Burkholderiales bacterium]|nr:cytochrome b/b6 domain-containing protein [Burkholderiales bacterium]